MSTNAEDGEEEHKFSIFLETDSVNNLHQKASPSEAFFGFDWHFYTVVNNSNNVTVSLFCKQTEPCNRRQESIASASLFSLQPTETKIASGDWERIGGCDSEKVLETSWNANSQRHYGNFPVKVRADVVIVTSIEPPLFDFSVPHAEGLAVSDVVLVVDGKEFHVSKTILSSFSTYFKTIFSVNYVESEAEKVVLEHIDADDFQELLEVIYHEKDVTLNNARELLEIVTYFDMRTIKKKCELVLVGCPNSKILISQQMLIADKFVLPKLMDKCMMSFKNVAELKAAMPTNMNTLSPATINRIVQKFVDLPL